MTVRKAVAKREEQAADKAAQPTLVQIAEATIATHADMLDAVLPAHVDRRRFAQMTIQAIRSAPELMRCFKTKQGAASFLLATGQAAMVGLEPNTPLQDCWILPRKRGQVQEAELMIGYRGIMRLARRSGTLRSIVAEAVREGDHFAHGYGTDGPWLEHTRATERGELTHAFCISWTKDGGRAQTVLDRVDVEKRRAMSESWRSKTGRPHSPWTKWPDEMWAKSAVRAHSPWLDLTVEAATVLSRDEQPLGWDPAAGAIEVGDTFGALEAGDVDGQADDDAPAGVDSSGVIEGKATEQPAREYAPDDPERPM